MLDARKYENWLKAKNVDKNLKQEIKAMKSNELKKAFSNEELAFGTAGIRAKIGPGTQYLNKFVYQQMAVGYAKYILRRKYKRPVVVIGHDNRLFSDQFTLICANVLTAYGIDVLLFQDNKLIPTPIISYAITRFKASGGINITASHNPKTDNGFKAYNNLGAQILPEDAKVIINNMPKSSDILSIELPKKGKKGKISYINYTKITTEYFKIVAKNAIINQKDFNDPKNPIKNMPIVFTGHHGTTSELMPAFLKFLGFKKVFVVPSQQKIDPYFSGSPISNPEDERSFDEAIKLAEKVGATIIFGCDPDGDRMAIGFRKTNRWRFMNGNEMGIIYTYYGLKYFIYPKKPYIISSWVSTNYIDRIAKAYGASVIRTKTGFKWMCNILNKCQKNGSLVVAFEEAIGALVHTCTHDKDSFGAIAQALEIYSNPNINKYALDLHDFLQQEIFDTFGPTFSRTYSYTIESSNWLNDAQTMFDRALKINKEKTKLFDYKIVGVKYNKDADAIEWILDKDSWIKFRISGTEPKFKVYFCLNNQMVGQLKSAADHIIKRIEQLILKGILLKK